MKQFYVMVHTIKLLLHYALDRQDTASDLESRTLFVGVTDVENNISFVPRIDIVGATPDERLQPHPQRCPSFFPTHFGDDRVHPSAPIDPEIPLSVTVLELLSAIIAR
jgi:hypothetical protein